ncbi:MAG: hypothetical protein K2X66_02085 [Cyanobacteria bacterium]|nr:hypothetical protein [Cyanobacteriota bacterium]
MKLSNLGLLRKTKTELTLVEPQKNTESQIDPPLFPAPTKVKTPWMNRPFQKQAHIIKDDLMKLELQNLEPQNFQTSQVEMPLLWWLITLYSTLLISLVAWD